MLPWACAGFTLAQRHTHLEWLRFLRQIDRETPKGKTLHHNTNPKPFVWTNNAADILQKVIRANSRLSSKQNATLH